MKDQRHIKGSNRLFHENDFPRCPKSNKTGFALSNQYKPRNNLCYM